MLLSVQYSSNSASEYTGAQQQLYFFCVQIFKGELNHRTTCCKCDMKNDSRSFFWILPLMVEDSRYKTYNVVLNFLSLKARVYIFKMLREQSVLHKIFMVCRSMDSKLSLSYNKYLVMTRYTAAAVMKSKMQTLWVMNLIS